MEYYTTLMQKAFTPNHSHVLGAPNPNESLAIIYQYTEIGSSLFLFLTSTIALIYTLSSKKRLVTVTNVFIFLLVTLSWGFMAALSIYDRGDRSEDPTSRSFEFTCNILYAL